MNWHTHCNLIIISRRGFLWRAVTWWCPEAAEAELLVTWERVAKLEVES